MRKKQSIWLYDARSRIGKLQEIFNRLRTLPEEEALKCLRVLKSDNTLPISECPAALLDGTEGPFQSALVSWPDPHMTTWELPTRSSVTDSQTTSQESHQVPVQENRCTIMGMRALQGPEGRHFLLSGPPRSAIPHPQDVVVRLRPGSAYLCRKPILICKVGAIRLTKYRS
jgi:hypothetical protein